MLNVLKEAIKNAPGDYAECHYESVQSNNVSLSQDRIESVSSAKTASGNARVFEKGGWGFASFNDDDYKSQLEIAAQNAKLVPHKAFFLKSPGKTINDDIETKTEISPDTWTLAQKFELARKYNEILKHPEIINTRVIYSDYTLDKYFVNSEGSAIHQRKIFTGLRLVATAKDGQNMQQAFESVGRHGGIELVTGLETKAEEVKKRALKLIKAIPVEGGSYRVILDPHLAGVFAHEAFGHLSEADFLHENPRMREHMKLGRLFGPEFLNIIDDGNLEGLAGYVPYDDEGVPAMRSELIKNGRLNGRLHSRETATLMDEDLTGNARAIHPGYQPIVRMTNTYIDKGATSFDEMLACLDDGIYAIDMLGGMTDLEMFTFSAAYAYRVRHGKIAEMLRDVVLTGNVFQTLHDILAVGDDLEHQGGLGGCGKGGQSPLPVSTGSPHLLIAPVLIGGK